MTQETTPLPRDGQPIVFRNGTVLTMNGRRDVLHKGDVLVSRDTIDAVGTALEVPEGTFEIDADGGILMPGMIDTHRHMWQTAMRGYGADWTLTQYFVWYYLEYGKHFRPQDIYAGNALSAMDAIDAGVTTTVDWSHGLRTIEHAEAALDALRASTGRFVFAPGNIFGAPWEWASNPEFTRFIRDNNTESEMLRFQLAFDVTGDPEFPERGAFETARELGLPVTTHAGVWGATNDDGIRLMYENGFMTPETVYVHAATLNNDSYQRIAATGGSVSLSTESEQSCGQGYPPSWVLRTHAIPMSLSVDTSVWFSSDLFSAMRATLGADRAWEHIKAHEKGDTITHSHLRAEHVVEWSTLGGAKALGIDDLVGSLEPGKKADVVLVKNDTSPTMFPIMNPYGHIALQAGRADVHTVLVNGAIAKFQNELLDSEVARAKADVEQTVDYLRSTLGDDVWESGMNPEIPETKVLDNPYMYTDYRSDATHRGAEPEDAEPAVS
ncbi:amidohydrolase family protein [Paramicrobacterium agarici]|uniref:Cytosine/adenosine deaminase-related metal-dependent hydrolase n=1 Tax=Paramicrobacterium agarici TaxID=630514 RepID=A0A2A9DSZ3_9MICO|nr:amidohydrolase family protein [Microbacterium agarici]PFG29713.1 cytosine/adenosine deaminase-related metal-dependent hydrolase [Microbacterium agarici]